MYRNVIHHRAISCVEIMRFNNKGKRNKNQEKKKGKKGGKKRGWMGGR